MRRAVLFLVIVAAFAPATAADGSLPQGADFRTATRISPGPHLFGDTLEAELDVFVDPHRADPGSVRVDTSFAAFQRTRYAHGRRDVDGLVELWYRYSLVCLDVRCVPKAAAMRITFPPATLRYRGRHGEKKPTYLLNWSSFRLVARAPKGATSTSQLIGPIGGNPEGAYTFRAPSSPPATKFRVSPLLLGVLLLLLAAAALAGGGVAALPVVARIRDSLAARAPAPAPRTRIEQALDDLRGHAEREPGSPAHRESLARLARELAAADAHELVRPATRLAWSAEAPTAEASRDLADHVAARMNGAHP